MGCTAFLLFDSSSVINVLPEQKLTTVCGLHGPRGAEKVALDRQGRTALVLMPQSKPHLIPLAVFEKVKSQESQHLGGKNRRIKSSVT